MDLAFILFLGGVVVIGFIGVWSWLQRENEDEIVDLQQIIRDVPAASSSDALLISQEHGRVVYANEPARRWLDMNGGVPHLEQIAQVAEPSDSFLELFAHEGQSSFQLGQRWVEASSHRFPYGPQEHRTVIVMRELTANANGNPDALDVGKAMTLINQIGENINASMSIEQVLQNTLMLLGRFVKFDAGEMCLWDEERQSLYPQGWVGDGQYVIALDSMGGRYEVGEGLTGWVAQYRKPLMLNNRDDILGIQPKVQNAQFASYITVPLLLGERFIGTMEVASREPYGFRQADLALMQAVSKPVAVAIDNALIYAKQVQRVDDLASLQQVTRKHESAATDASDVYLALNERVAKLLNAEMCGIFFYNEDRHGLVSEPPFYGFPESLLSQPIVIPLQENSPQYDIWINQPYWISNNVRDEALVENLGMNAIIEPAGIRNIAMMPLQVSTQRIGALVISNKRGEEGFTPLDIQNMIVLSAQASIVIENVRLAQRERRMDTERVGLQEITDAIGALSHEAEFYGEVTGAIAKLMQLEMCGILIYDETRQQLISRPPFFGVEDDYIQNYSIDLSPGTIMEQLWDDEPFWYSNRVQTDPLVYTAGLDELAASLNIGKTMMARLQASGRRLGVIQVSNKHSGEDFTDADAQLLMIFATQVAAIMENARLYREARRSAEQAQGLRRIAELAGNVMSSQEAFLPVLAEIGKLMRSDLVFVNVLDEQTGSLVTYPRWVYGMELTEPIYQDIYSPGFELSVSVSHKAFMSNNVLHSDRVIDSYRQIAQRLNISSAVLVPLIFGDQTLGELGIANRPDEPYVEDDLGIMQSIAAQIASALDRLLVYEATGQNLNRRLEELDSISRVSNELTNTVELPRILTVIYNEAIRSTNADGGSVILLRPVDEWQFPDQPEVEQRMGEVDGMRISDLAPIEREAIMRGADTVLISDYEFSTMQAAPQRARSAVAAAMLYLDRVVGVIHLYHFDPNHFDDRAATFSMTLAVKGALGYGNFARFQEQYERGESLRKRVEQVNRIFELGHMIQTNADPVGILDTIAYAVQEAVEFDSVLMTLVDEETNVLQRVAHAGLPVEYFEETRDNVISLKTLRTLFQPAFKISESYFFPVRQVANWYVDGIAALSVSYDGKRTINTAGNSSWHDGDMLLVPMYSAAGKLLGVMSLDRPYNNFIPDEGTIKVLEIFARQAAISIENTSLYLSSVRNAEREAQLNELMEAVSSTLDMGDIAQAIAHGMLRLLDLHRLDVTLIKPDGNGFDQITVEVVDPIKPELNVLRNHTVDLSNTLMNEVYEQGFDQLFTLDDRPAQVFEDLTRWRNEGEHISMVLPLNTGGERIGVVHLGSRQAKLKDFESNRVLLRRMAQLVASSVQNARLFNRAVELQIENRSVLESIQQGIVVVDNSGHIISTNDFMRTRYSWDNGDLAGRDLFEFRPEMAGFLSEDLQTVLSTGEPTERINQIITSGGSDMIVSNFYVYPLRSNAQIRGAVILVEDVTERARLEQTMEARANQLAALTDVSGRITSSLEREGVLQLALEEMGWLIPHDAMSIWRRTGSYLVLEGAIGDVEEVAFEDGYRFLYMDYDLTSEVVQGQRVVSANERTRQVEDIPIHRNAQSWMGVPLVNQGHIVGMIMMTSYEADAYSSKSDQNIALAFAGQVAIALANADLFEQTFDRTNELGTLLEAATATSMTTDLDSVFNTVVELMFSALDMDDCAIMIWDQVEGELEVQIDMNRNGDEDRIMQKGTRIDLENYPAKLRALTDREVIVIQKIDTNSPYPNEMKELLANGDTARMLVPLIVSEQARGLIQLEQSRPDDEAITQQKVRLARALGTQVAIAIENARLSAETTSHFEESLIINDLSRAISSTLDLDDMIQIVAEQLPNVMEASEIYLALYDSETEQITFPLAVRDRERYYLPGRQLSNDEVSFIIRHRRPLSLGADYFSPDELRRSLGITNGEGDVKSYMGVPLISSDQVYGVLAVRDTNRTRAFTVNEQRILTTVGSQLGAAIQNARLFARTQYFNEQLNQQVSERTYELEEERDRLDTLYQITSELSRTLDMERLVPRALGMVAKAVGAQDGVIMQIDPITDQLYSRSVLNPTYLPTSDDGLSQVQHPAERIARWSIEHDEPSQVIDDLHLEEFWDPEAPGAEHWRSALAVLLETNEEPLGVMVMLNREPNAFVESHVRLMVAAGNQVASSINNAELYKLIRDQAQRLGLMLKAEQEEAEKNKAILEGIADGVILSDKDGVIVLFNNAAERILEIPRDEAINHSLTKLTGIYGLSAQRWANMMENRYYEGSDSSPQYLNERLTLGDKTVSVHLSPVYTGEKFLGTVSVLRDVTAEVEADRSKSQFVSNVSHEFRTPLTPMKGYTDLLLMGAAGEITDQQRSILDTIKQNVDRLSLLVEDVLNISQIDSGREQLKIEDVNMVQVINSVIDNLQNRPQHQNKPITVNFTAPEDVDPVIQADKDKVMRIISNVMDNAFNYSNADGTIDVDLQLVKSEGCIVVSIRDYGVGIPEDFREAIWRRFERHDETALMLDVAGTGLGLPIVKELVELHKGEVTFESEVGEGTTFFVTLPLTQPEYLMRVGDEGQ